MTLESKSAIFAGGCFWCIEAVFRELSGVQSVESGYTGGHTDNPTYKDICSGTTGHAEVIKIEYDPKQISYRDLLTIFFHLHDPTTLNRQGNDVGTQYRSAIFTNDQTERETAAAVISEIEASDVWSAPVVTTLEPLAKYFPAEDYHQNYFAENPDQPYCLAVIPPKLKKLRKNFSEFLT